MAGEWKDATLGDFVSLQRGHDLTDGERRAGKVPVMGSAGQNGFHDTARVKGPGIVIGRSGASFGKVHYTESDFWPHNTALYVTNFKGNDPRFAFYFLNSINFDGFNSGSAQPSLNRNFIYPIPVRIPPLPEQKAIARILGALDEKIELNRRMNTTLEAMARALFQSWFVDCLPVGASLPDGWEMSTIGAEAKVVGGSTPSTKKPELWEDGEFHWVTPKDLSAMQSKVLIGSSRKITAAGLNQITSGLLPENTVLLSSRAPVGYLSLTKIRTAINQGFIAIICEDRLPPEYVMLWADSIMDKIKQASSGTTFAEISKTTFRPFPILVPPTDKLNNFVRIVRPLYQRVAANECEIVTLGETRDTLLPKLLSGKLSLEEVVNVD